MGSEMCIRDRFLRDTIDNRKVFIGDSAQAIHPLAGQGLNLGLRDVASLVDILLKGKKLGLDLGSNDLLKQYESWRSFDRISLATYTDFINTLFSNNNFYLKTLRELGMNALDRSDLLKSFYVKEAAGEYGNLPELLKQYRHYLGLLFAKILCNVLLCMFNLLAVSETFLLHLSLIHI